ncbi:MAG: hypothetical protein ACRD2A_14390, partial [Vicinamibacterales bacterium]
MFKSRLRSGLASSRRTSPGKFSTIALIVVASTGAAVGAQRPGVASEAEGHNATAVEAIRTKRPTAAQRDNIEARISTARAIVDRLEADARRLGLLDSWRQAALETLLPLSLDALRQVEQ